MTLFIVVLVAQGCYYDKEEELYPFAYCDTSNVTWSGTIEPIVQGRCAIPGCHVTGGDGPGNFTTYAGVKAVADNGKLRQRVVVQGDMPPGGGLSSCQKLQFNDWIQAGAPQN